MRYSLINICKELDGFVDGVWLQDSNEGIERAIKAARDTEKANSNRIAVAVVKGLSYSVPNYSIQTGLRRIDAKGLKESGCK